MRRLFLASQSLPSRSQTRSKSLVKDKSNISSPSISAYQLQTLDVHRISDPDYWNSLQQNEEQGTSTSETFTKEQGSSTSETSTNPTAESPPESAAPIGRQRSRSESSGPSAAIRKVSQDSLGGRASTADDFQGNKCT